MSKRIDTEVLSFRRFERADVETEVTYDIAWPVEVIECYANKATDGELDALAETVLELLTVPEMSYKKISTLLMVSEEVVKRILASLEAKGYYADKTVTETGKKYLSVKEVGEFTSEMVFGNMFISMMDGEVLPYFYPGKLPWAVQNEDMFYLSYDDETQNIHRKGKKDLDLIDKVNRAYHRYGRINKMSQDKRRDSSRREIEFYEDSLVDRDFNEPETLVEAEEMKSMGQARVKILDTERRRIYIKTRFTVKKANPDKFIVESPFPINFTPWYSESFRRMRENNKIKYYPVTISHHKYECVGAYKWMPKLNTSNSRVREYFINVMEYWIKDFGIDGWRLDVADEVDKSVWTQARILLKEKYPNTILLGETWGCAISMMMGDQMDSAMNYMFRDSVRDYLALDIIDEEAFDARLNRILSTYFGNSKHQLYNLLDSHDTERFLYFAKEDKNKLKLAAAMQMLFPGSPAVYYGDEIGMTGDNDPDCRRAMEWDTNKQDLSMLEWYRTLIKLRKSEACIRNGEYATVLCSKENHLFGFVRYNDNQSVYAIFNNSNNKQTIDVPVLKVADYKDCLTGEIIKTEKTGENDDYYNQDVLEYEGRLKMCVEPYSMKVIKQN